MRRVARLLSIVGAASVGMACGPDIGSIEGDMFEGNNGAVRRMAGQQVVLIPRTDSLHHATTAACESHERRRDSLEAQQFDALKRARDFGRYLQYEDSLTRVDSLLESRLEPLLHQEGLRTTKTDINAHYRFEDVALGHYILLARTLRADGQYGWWFDTVVVSKNETSVRDLTSELDTQRLCWTPLGTLLKRTSDDL